MALCLLGGCARSGEEEFEPPLRPLLYTERPSDESVVPPPGYELWNGSIDPTAYPDEPQVLESPRAMDVIPPDQVDLSTPEALARALFRALVRQEESLLHRLILTDEEYSAMARTNLDSARENMTAVREETFAVLDTFRGEVASEQRPGGFGSLLQIESVVVNRGRLATGELARGDEVPVMIWGTEVHMRLYDSNLVFRLRLPKILRSPDGHWGLAEAPEVGGMLALFLQMGFHLSPAMLSFEHYPFPLETGNYWTYRVREVPRERDDLPGLGDEAGTEDGDLREPDEFPTLPDGSGSGDSAPATPRDDQPDVPLYPQFTDEVMSREDFDGYSLVGIHRTFDDPERSGQRFYYILTARRLYRCDRDCRRNIADVSWLLAQLSRRVPELVFPLEPGFGWRTGGRLDIRGEFQTRSRFEVADVPAGRFEETICITRSVTQGQEHRYFAPSIGFVLIRMEGTTHTTYHELVEYRIIP